MSTECNILYLTLRKTTIAYSRMYKNTLKSIHTQTARLEKIGPWGSLLHDTTRVCPAILETNSINCYSCIFKQNCSPIIATKNWTYANLLSASVPAITQ